MGNQNGQMYGLTVLSPIKDDPNADPSDETAIRNYLAALPNGSDSPFAKVTSTHLCRLVVMDDVVFVGAPAVEEHLKSAYLMFTSNFDGGLEDYLKLMLREIPDLVDGVWKHCAGYPGTGDVEKFIAYMKKCQLTTTFFFADVNDKTLQQTLRALQVQRALTAFIEANQGKPAAELKAAFQAFLEKLKTLPPPKPGWRPAPGEEEAELRVTGAGR